MSAIRAASEALAASLRSVADLRVYTDPGAPVDPPGAFVGPPALSWETFSTSPVRATFLVYLVAAQNDRALESLWDLVPVVSDAIATYDRAAVITAEPGSWLAGRTELPAYVFTVETTL